MRERPVTRLEQKLASALKPMLGGDIRVIVYPAQGYYRKPEADVQAWTGYVYCDGRALWDIGSWDTVTKCLRGFSIADCRGKQWADADFQVSAA